MTSTTLDVTVTPWIILGGSAGYLVLGKSRILTLATSYKWFYLDSLIVERPENLPTYKDRMYVGIKWEWGASASHTGKLDFIMVVNGEMWRLINVGSDSWKSIWLSGKTANGVDINENLYDKIDIRGDAIDLVPDLYNVIWLANGNDNATHGHSDVGYFDLIQVVPRYALL